MSPLSDVSAVGRGCRRPCIGTLKRAVTGSLLGREGGCPGNGSETPQPGCLRHFVQSIPVRFANRRQKGFLTGSKKRCGNTQRTIGGVVLALVREGDRVGADRSRLRYSIQASNARSGLCVRGGFADGVVDDSMIRSTRTAKDKISAGSWQIAKSCGISWGRRLWKRSVSSVLHGASWATRLRLPSRVCVVNESWSATVLRAPGRCCPKRM